MNSKRVNYTPLTSSGKYVGKDWRTYRQQKIFLRMDITKYRNIFPHVAAAIQLGNNGKPPTKGDVIQYVYTDS
ncbi:MAG TPA: hypothetical protein VF884_00465 [Nitrososphaeraceae archaeon]